MAAHGVNGSDGMRVQGESARVPPSGAGWVRRVLVSLWILAFLLFGSALAARWDALMARLAGPPAAAVEGALR
jgi:hypothetical protein